MKQNILLLTSTIKPNPNQPQLSLVDPEARLKDYEMAMKFYAHELEMGRVDKIVFVDNSEFDLSRLSNRFQSDNIEWLSFNGLDYPNTYHRGYGEFKLIDYAFSHSVFLSDMDDEDVVWKVTGRYIVKNLGNVIRFAPRNFDLYCDVKNKWISMEIMAWNKRGYTTYIKGAWKGFATQMAPELILVDSIKSNLGKGMVCMSYLWPPYIAGRRGTDGGNFIGRFTPIKFGLVLVRKAAMWPIRYLTSIEAR